MDLCNEVIQLGLNLANSLALRAGSRIDIKASCKPYDRYDDPNQMVRQLLS